MSLFLKFLVYLKVRIVLVGFIIYATKNATYNIFTLKSSMKVSVS